MGYVTSYLTLLVNFCKSLFTLLSNWMIVDGVSVLGFLIAIACMSIVFGAILYRV